MAAFASITFALFLASLFGFIRQGFNREGQFQRAGMGWGVGSALLFISWLWALRQAPPPYPLENLKRYEAPHQIPATPTSSP